MTETTINVEEVRHLMRCLGFVADPSYRPRDWTQWAQRAGGLVTREHARSLDKSAYKTWARLRRLVESGTPFVVAGFDLDDHEKSRAYRAMRTCSSLRALRKVVDAYGLNITLNEKVDFHLQQGSVEKAFEKVFGEEPEGPGRPKLERTRIRRRRNSLKVDEFGTRMGTYAALVNEYIPRDGTKFQLSDICQQVELDRSKVATHIYQQVRRGILKRKSFVLFWYEEEENEEDESNH